jgi:hypothetical protein
MCRMPVKKQVGERNCRAPGKAQIYDMEPALRVCILPLAARHEQQAGDFQQHEPGVISEHTYTLRPAAFAYSNWQAEDQG